jgi:hypothetical protein
VNENTNERENHMNTENARQPMKTMLFVGVLITSVVASVAVWAANDAHDGKGQTRGFFASGFPNGATVALGTDFTEIQRLQSLPRGNYVANASAGLTSNYPDLLFVDCVFTIGGFIQGDVARGMVGGTGISNFVSLPLTVGFRIKKTQDLVLACRSDVADVVFSQNSPVTAIRVDRLKIQP